MRPIPGSRAQRQPGPGREKFLQVELLGDLREPAAWAGAVTLGWP